MRPGAPVLATALFLGAAAPLHADEWTLIDVKARLTNDQGHVYFSILPLPAEGWTASAIVVLAGYYLTLARSRLPVGDGGVLADLLRMRAYAQAELQRPRPQLDDRWVPRLRAL